MSSELINNESFPPALTNEKAGGTLLLLSTSSETLGENRQNCDQERLTEGSRTERELCSTAECDTPTGVSISPPGDTPRTRDASPADERGKGDGIGKVDARRERGGEVESNSTPLPSSRGGEQGEVGSISSSPLACQSGSPRGSGSAGSRSSAETGAREGEVDRGERKRRRRDKIGLHWSEGGTPSRQWGGSGRVSGESGREGSREESCLSKHNVKIRGSGPNLLLLAHGFGTNQTVWDGVLKHLDLKNTFRVILWDLMGAFSTNPEKYDAQRYSSLHAHADDLLEILDELHVQKVTYVGHSMSGMIGILASIECPHKFLKLILLGASCRYLDSEEDGYVGGFNVGDLDELCGAIQSNYTTWVSGYSSLAVGGSIQDPSVREFGRTLFLLRPDIALMTLKCVFLSDFRSVLPKVSVPVVLLRTEHDHAVPIQVVGYMQEHLPHATCQVLPLAGHLPHLTHPLIVADAVSRHASPCGNPIAVDLNED